jgi:carbon storage regulator
MIIVLRGIGESLMIGEDVIVKVLAIKGSQVEIGIIAQKRASKKDEIYLKILEENEVKSVVNAAKDI